MNRIRGDVDAVPIFLFRHIETPDRLSTGVHYVAWNRFSTFINAYYFAPQDIKLLHEVTLDFHSLRPRRRRHRLLELVALLVGQTLTHSTPRRATLLRVILKRRTRTRMRIVQMTVFDFASQDCRCCGRFPTTLLITRLLFNILVEQIKSRDLKAVKAVNMREESIVISIRGQICAVMRAVSILFIKKSIHNATTKFHLYIYFLFFLVLLYIYSK